MVYTRLSSQVKNSIGSPDALVILSSTVSDFVCWLVESQAKKMDIPIIRHKNSSKVAFNECLSQVDLCLGNCQDCRKLGKCKGMAN